MRNFGGAASGEVVSMDTTSLTLKLRDGGSRIVFLGSSTPIMKTTEGALSDITVGSAIIAGGELNPDGSINARSLEIRSGMSGSGVPQKPVR